MFNSVNVDNRRRDFIAGRVIVFTTSKTVEFLNHKLTDSYPLLSQDSYPEGTGLVFTIEAKGFLTFDADSYVKISPEFGPYTKFDFDPTAWSIVRASDAKPVDLIVSATINYFAPHIQLVDVTIASPDGSTYVVQLCAREDYSSNYEYRMHIDKVLIPGKPWLTTDSYENLYRAT